MKLTLEQAQKMMDENDGNLDLAAMEYDELPEGLNVDGYLNLYNTRITSLPDGLTVGGSLYLSNTPITSLPIELTVGGILDLSNTRITNLPAGLTIGGWLDLSNTRITNLPAGLTIGGWLDLSDTPITSLSEDLTVSGSLDLRNTPITSLPKGLIVGGYLDLHNTRISSLPEGLIVGGYLNLYKTPITSLPEGLIVGDGLGLSNTQITNLPKKITVGGRVLLHKVPICDKEYELQKVHYLQDGDYVEGKYLYADGILTHIKEKRQVNGYTLYIGKIPGRNVVSDGKNYAHCDKLRDGIADLLYKAAVDRGADQYKGMTLDTELPVADLITMYRVVTGACRQRTQAFVDSIKDKKEKYTIREVIQLTDGQYGAEKFKEFFEI